MKITSFISKWLHGCRFCKQWAILQYLTPMTALDPSSYGSPNLLQDLEMWEKFESNVPVCICDWLLSSIANTVQIQPNQDRLALLFIKEIANRSHDFDLFPRTGKELARCELRPFFGSHASTSHVQIWVRTHTCAHVQFKVVALHTRTRTFCKFFYNFSTIG